MNEEQQEEYDRGREAIDLLHEMGMGRFLGFESFWEELEIGADPEVSAALRSYALSPPHQGEPPIAEPSASAGEAGLEVIAMPSAYAKIVAANKPE